MRAKRKDTNHNAVTEALEKAGYFVYDTHSLGDGFPDILVVDRDRRTVLLEIKSSRSEPLTIGEKIFMLNYPGYYAVAHSPEEAIAKMQMFEHTTEV